VFLLCVLDQTILFVLYKLMIKFWADFNLRVVLC
jgi:hypothetical protein